VRDAAALLLGALGSALVGVVNVARGDVTTLGEVAGTILEAAGRGGGEIDQCCEAPANRAVVSTARLGSLGLRATTSLRGGLEELVAWRRAHR
jgi:nucleoside-diphosphate-sugar epimerase